MVRGMVRLTPHEYNTSFASGGIWRCKFVFYRCGADLTTYDNNAIVMSVECSTRETETGK